MTLEGWRLCRLDEVADIVGGGTPSKDVPRYWGGSIPWATPSDITALRGRHIRETALAITEEGLAASSAKRLPAGSVLLTSRATVGACALAEVPITTNQGFQSLIPRDGVSSDFLLYLVKSLHAELNRRAAGSTFLEISKSSLRGVTVMLPPLSEQRKIGAILSSVDEVIEKTELVIERLHSLKKAMMHELLTRGPPRRHTRFTSSEIGRIPLEWKVTLLGNVASAFNGRAAGRGGSWLRVFKTKHVYDGMLGLDQLEFARDDSAAKTPPHTYLQTGDTVTPNMAHGTIGRVSYVPHADERWATDGQVMVLRTLDREILDGRFLFEYMSSDGGRRRLIDCEKGSIFDEKRGQTHIYPADVKAIPVALPPIHEQREIAGVLASFDGPLAENARCIAPLRDVKAGLMQRLLSGELRITASRNAS